MRGSSELPRTVLAYLQKAEARGGEQLIRRFHEWLANKGMVVSAVGPKEIELFIRKPLQALVTPRTARASKLALLRYLGWLHERGELDFDPREFRVRKRAPLPDLAESFLRSLEPTHRLSTCRGHRTTIRQFHLWLGDARVRLERLTRAQAEQWLLSLSDGGLHPSTRVQRIQQIRSYLRWVAERGELRHDPDALIRGSDLPRLPQYLPRPLPPDIDRELQDRLARSSHPLWKGLLLMRQTGLRIGELRTLQYDCIRSDHHANNFLKVPLGKLDNERLVPIGETTCSLIREIQQLGLLQRPYLLEPIRGGAVTYLELKRALCCACEGLRTPEPITSHRLRHTYATELLNGGMSLVAIMKLLGHRDFRMTLRYAAITQESVGKEYFQALRQLEARYAALRTTKSADPVDPIAALTEVAAWTQSRLGRGSAQQRMARNLVKRLLRLRDAIASATVLPRGPRPE